MKTRYIFFLLVSVAATGCYYDKEDQLYNCTIDVTNSKYSTTVTNTMISYGCLGCHGTISPSGGVILNTYAGTKAVAADGRLYGSIAHIAGFNPMPQGSSKMSDCDIKKIKAWIDAGAPNN